MRNWGQLSTNLKKDLLEAVNANPGLLPQAAMKKITQDMLENNPYDPPSTCQVSKLPPEVLAHIFRVGTQMEVEAEYISDEEDEENYEMDDWTDEEDVDPDDLDKTVKDKLRTKGKVVEGQGGVMDVDEEEEEKREDELKGVLQFQVLVSHVCRHWREVALETPPLWTSLDFMEPAPYEKSQAWIQRAKNGPLDISIDCSIPTDEEDMEEHDEEHDEEHQEGLSRPSRNVITAEAHGEFYAKEHAACSHPPPQFSLTDLRQILDIIVPHVAQWRHLEVTVTVWEYMHTVLSRLSQCPAAPLLETLQLYYEEEIEEYDVFSPPELREPFCIFNGEAPNLRNVALYGVHLDWDRSVSLLSDLHDLEMTFHAEDVRPSYATFTQIIAANPNLDTFTLCLSGPKEHDAETNDWGTDPIEIPSLKAFVFNFHKASYAIALIKKLSLPNVHSLSMNYDSEDYTEFVKQLALPMPNSKKSLLAGLEHMKISGLPCNRASIEIMLGQLAGLKTFNINCSGEEETEIFKKLHPHVKPITGGPSSSHPKVYCPALYSITTTGVTGPEMRTFVESRKVAGAPLRRVMMSEDDEIDEKDVIWLRSQVEELEFFEPSDSEEEFDSEDEDEMLLSDDDDDQMDADY
ncbi:hypothetical protein H0H87_003454 [Tephrocybe sp. NHM501043]|nr:hypothetical protein H0H87_003454 [Tephrocybe sp. NHM501043]